MSKHNITLAIEREENEEELELEIEYDYHSGYSGSGPSLNNPGDPPEPPEIELISVTHNGKAITLTDEEEEYLYEQILDDYEDEEFGYDD
jgi:hypothetical protein